jgi:hypothetical protein
MPIIDNIVLPAGRCLVLTDLGSKVTGVIFRKSEQGFVRLEKGQPIPEDPNDPQPPPIPYSKVLFLKKGIVKVEVNGVEYLAMHQSNIVGINPD